MLPVENCHAACVVARAWSPVVRLLLAMWEKQQGLCQSIEVIQERQETLCSSPSMHVFELQCQVDAQP